MDLDKLKAQLVKHEGLVLHIYYDSVGIPTIGVGHNTLASPVPFDYTNGITREQAMIILDRDIAKVTSFLTTRCPWWNDLDDVRQCAIADLTFNLMGRLLEFKHMIAAIQAKDWDKASDELLASTFAKQVGKRAQDLAAMIKTGQYV